MRIIKKGSLVKLNPVYEFECYDCGTKFIAYKSECITEKDYREPSVIYKCPVCEKNIYGKQSVTYNTESNYKMANSE